MAERWLPVSPDLYLSSEPCVEATVEGIPNTPLYLAERWMQHESRTKVILMKYLCLVDENGQRRVTLGPASGFMEAHGIPGVSMWPDQQAIDKLQQAPIDPLDNPIPHMELTPDGRGYRQVVVPLGHSLETSFGVLHQERLFSTGVLRRLGTVDNTLLDGDMIRYQLLRLIRNELRAVESLHRMGLVHKDMGQHFHLQNGLSTYKTEQIYLIDYSFLEIVLPGNESAYTHEQEALTATIKSRLQAAGLDDFIRAQFGQQYYDEKIWTSLPFGLSAQQVLEQIVQAGNAPITQPQDAIADRYARAFIYSRANDEHVSILHAQTEDVLDCIKDYYAQSQTLGLFRNI